MRGPTSAQISRIWRVQAMICTESACAQNGGTARVLFNPPASLNVMLE